MQFEYVNHILPLIVASFIALGVSWYAWSHRSVSGATTLGWLALAVGDWAIGYALEIAGADLATKVFWAKFEYIGIATIPLLWLIFSYNYFNPNRQMPSQVIAALGIIPLTTLVLVFTTEFHGLIWSRYFVSHGNDFSFLGVVHGFWFWIYWIYANLLLLGGMYFIIKSIRHKHGLYRGQIVAMMIAVIAPWIGNFLYISGLSLFADLDLTPFGLTITVVLTAWAIFRFQLINLSPVARDAVIDRMVDGMIAIDAQGRIVDINPAAARMIGVSVAYAIGRPAREVFNPWPRLFEKFRNTREAREEIVVGAGAARRRFEVTLSPLYDPQDNYTGRIIILRSLDSGPVPAHKSTPADDISVHEVQAEIHEENEQSTQPVGDALSDIPLIGWLMDSFLAPIQTDARVLHDMDPNLYPITERAFTSILRMAAILAPLITLLSRKDFANFQSGYILFLVTDFFLGILALVRVIPFKVRVIGFLLVFYVFGTLEAVSLGYVAESFIFFMVVILSAATLTSRKIAWIAFLISFGTLAFLGWQISQGYFIPLALDSNILSYRLLRPLPILLTFAGGAAGLGITIASMWTSMTYAWQREKQATNLLRQERDFLDERVQERARDLAESEAKYRTLVEQLPVVVYQDKAEEERTSIYISPQIETLLGYSLAEFEQDPDLWDKIVYPQDYPFVNSIAREIITQGYSNSEYRLVKRDGCIVWLRDEAVLVRDEANQIQFIQGIMQDITARKQAEASLHQSETRYRGLFEDSPISLWEEDLSEVKKVLNSLRQQGVEDFGKYLENYPDIVHKCLELIKIIDVNKATLQMYGISSKTELLGKLTSILGSSGLAAFRSELVSVAQGKSQFEWTGKNQTLSGDEIEVHLHWSALPGHEEDLSRVIISVMDITKLKNAEKELNRHNRQLEALHQVSLELLNRRKMDDLLQSIVNRAAVLLEAPFCEIMLKEDEELVVRAFTTNQPYLKGDHVRRDQAKLSWQAYDSGEPIIADDYTKWPEHRSVYDNVGLQAVADFPIMMGERCFGVLGIGRNQPGFLFDEQQIRIGRQFAQIIALVLNNVQLLDQSSLQAAALNATANAILITDQHGTIQWVNSAFTNLTGYEFNEAIGKNPRFLQSGRTSPEIYPELWQTVLSGEAWHGELFNRRKDGKDFVEEMTITPLSDENGNIYRLIAVMQDISDRKRSEEALRLSEEKYRSIFENIEDVFYATDYQGHIVTISPSIEKHSGFRPDEIIGKHVRTFFVNHEDYEKLDLAISTQGVLHDYEMAMKKKDGSLIYVSATARVVFDKNGQPIGTDGVMRDISERKQNEIRQQRRRALLEKVVEMSKTVAQAVTFKECLVMIHQAVQKGLGFDRVGLFLYDETNRLVQGAMGTSRTGELEENSWFTQSLEEDEAWDSALKSPKGFFIVDNYEEYHEVPNDSEMKGVQQHVIFSAWAGDKPVAFISTDNLISQDRFTDEQLEALQLFAGYAGLAIENARWKNELEDRVFERTFQLQESNANLSALAESSLALNKILDLDQVLHHVLIQARKIVPCRTLSIMFREGEHNYVARRLGDPDIDVSNLRIPNTWYTFQRMITNQESVLVSDTSVDPHWQQTSATNWVLSYIGVPIIINGEAVGFLNANHDEANYFSERARLLLEALASHASIAVQNARLIGNLKLALEKEQTMRNQLVHADKLAALGKMVAVIAHEINNPIQTVKNAFFLIEDEIEPTSAAQEYLKIAKSEATRIADLVSQLRETYRARSKTFTRVDLVSLLSEVKSILLPQLKKSDVTWNQLDTSLVYWVFATKGNLKQVFINLALNGIEAMEEGGCLTVSVELSQDRENVGVKIHNTGALISEEDRPHIFEPFFTTKGSGSGLGLSISYDIIQQHGGKIEVESTPEKGVTFTVWLPLAPDS